MEGVAVAIINQTRDFCYPNMKNATAHYEKLFATGRGDQVKKVLGLCDDFDPENKKDQGIILSTIALVWANRIQYHK